MQNLVLSQPQPFSNFKVTLLLETLVSGQIMASIREFPDCRVEAETRETAIIQLQTTFLERLKRIEAITWDVSVPTVDNSWMQFAGVFRDDPDFQEIMAEIRADRTTDDDSEVDPSYYL
ncbi:MAG: hypothetical protein HC916_06180 [Coleofasciculaceae cyanobacterium SM2_1_6]|nr:hypothetical protein [Coleofasciculaceae cyanobacterium SM2_1_6]